MRTLGKLGRGRHALVRVIGLCLIAASTSGCAGDASSADGYVIRDSADVRIVENSAPQWTSGDRWRVADTPSVVIGAGLEDEQALLYNVSGARRFNDGRFVVANDGSKQLLFFDSAGNYLHAVGRRGEGPGEFEYITAFWLCGDSLRVSDGRLSRFSVFDGDGRFARSFEVRLPTRPQPPTNLDCQDDGKLILSDWGDPARGVGSYRPAISVMIADAAGEIVTTIGAFPGHEYIDGFTSHPVFRKLTSIEFVDDRAYIGTADQYEIAVYDLEGTLESLVRKAGERRAVADEDIARYKQEALAGITDPEDRRRRRQRLSELTYAEHMPVYAGFIHDAAGNLWVKEYRRPWEEESRWTVFTPEGVMLGSLELPRGLVLVSSWVEIGQIGNEFLLGVTRDELDVERVVLYRLVK